MVAIDRLQLCRLWLSLFFIIFCIYLIYSLLGVFCKVAVPRPDPASTTSSTTTTGTSTGPQPSTVETGTQSSGATGSQPQPTTSTFGSQHDAGLSEDEVQRISQQMSAGLQNVLGRVSVLFNFFLGIVNL